MKFHPYWKHPMWWLQIPDLPISRKETINFISKCQNPDGGFGNSPNSPSYAESSYYAIVLLGWLDATGIIRKQKAIEFFMERFNDDGGFGDELGRSSDLFNTFYAIISLNMLDALENIDREKTLNFLIEHQKTDGGFNEHDIEYSDMVRTFWSTIALDNLHGLQIADTKRLASFIEKCQNRDGGYGSRPNKASFVEYTYEAIAIKWLLERLDNASKKASWNFVRLCQNATGRFGEQAQSPSTMSDTLWAVALLSIIDCLNEIERYKLVRFLSKLRLIGIWHRFCTIISLLYLIPSEIVIKPRVLNIDLFKVRELSILGLAKMTETEVVKVAPQIVKLDISTMQNILDEIYSFQGLVNSVWVEGKDPTSINFEKPARAFGELLYYSVIPEKLEGQFKETPRSFVNLSIDESLLGIPWELIFDGKEYLCLKHAVSKQIISNRYSFKTLSREPKEEVDMLVIGYSIRRESKDQGTEISNLERYLKQNMPNVHADSFIGKKAQKQVLIRQMLKKPYDIIHFSGHVHLDHKHPEKSGLIVSDGVLEASDLGKYLRKNPPRLAFINGCESTKQVWTSGFRSEQRALGLASAFLTLGVPFIGSYFPIHDKEATVFGSFFYKHVLQGLPLAEAVREARQETYDEFKGKGLAWASYNIFGNPIDRICFFGGR